MNTAKPEIRTLVSVDNTAGVSIVKEAELQHTFETDIEMFWQSDIKKPSAPQPYWAFHEATRKLKSSLSDEEKDFLRAYGSEGEWRWFNGASPDASKLINALGYSYTEVLTVIPETGRKELLVTSVMPSIAAWNTITDTQVDVSKSLTLEGFDGSTYCAFEAMKKFVHERKVMLAMQSPLKLHDHGAHPIGWFVMGPALLDEIESQAETAILRAEIEAQLPQIGTSQKLHEADRAFMNPSETFLRNFWGKLDAASDLFTQLMCFSDSKSPTAYSSTYDKLFRSVEGIFEPSTYQPPFTLLQIPKDDLLHKITAELLSRYDLLAKLVLDDAVLGT